MRKKIDDGMNARDRYNKKNMLYMSFAFNKVSEQHIIDYINSQPNKSRFLKDLVLSDMEKKMTKLFRVSETAEYNSLDSIRFVSDENYEEITKIPSTLVSYNQLAKILETSRPQRVYTYYTVNDETEEIQNLGYEIF